MGGTSTVYDVKVRYALDDKASTGVKGIAKATDKAAQSAFSLKSALAAVGGVALLKGAKNMLVDFNSEIDQMKIGMTTVMQMQLKMPFEKARVEADKLFKVFQEMAKKSPATTKDFMEMGNAIAPVVAMMGGGPDKISKLAQGGVLASQAFGERADIVALDIKQMLMGTVSSRDRIAQQLIASQGMDSTKFNALDAKKRASMTESMLQDPALLKAADQMGASFAGQVSTFKDMLQITLGQVGLPLMQAMTAEVKRWNNWIEKHPKTIKEWVTTFGNGVKSAFEFVKNVAGWLVEHKDLIFSLAKTFVMFKGAQIATNVFKRFTDGVGGLADSVKGAIANFRSGGAGGLIGGFGGVVGTLGRVVPALTLFSGALEIATHLLNANAEAEKKARDNALSLNEATGDIPSLLARRQAIKDRFAQGFKPGDSDLRDRLQQEYFGINKQVFNPESLGLALRKISEASEKGGGVSLKGLSHTTDGLLSPRLLAMLPDTFDRKNLAENTKIMQQVDQTLKTFQNLPTDIRNEALKFAFPEQYGMPTPTEDKAPGADWKGLTTPEVNVTIHKVEVASEDPDRFVFGLAKLAEQAVKHQTQSRHATPGGM